MQVWAPQSAELIKQLERVQRRATQYILPLPFRRETTSKGRLIETNLALTYLHEYLDMVFFFKATNGHTSFNEPTLRKKTKPNIFTRFQQKFKSNAFEERTYRTST